MERISQMQSPVASSGKHYKKLGANVEKLESTELPKVSRRQQPTKLLQTL